MLLAASRLKIKKVQNFILSIFVTAVVEIRRGDSKLSCFMCGGIAGILRSQPTLRYQNLVSFIIYLFIHSLTTSACGLLRQQGPNWNSGISGFLSGIGSLHVIISGSCQTSSFCLITCCALRKFTQLSILRKSQIA
jgi:hypothetical protein